MKKLITKIIGLGLGLTLATSVGVVAFVAYNNTSSEHEFYCNIITCFRLTRTHIVLGTIRKKSSEIKSSSRTIYEIKKLQRRKFPI